MTRDPICEWFEKWARELIGDQTEEELIVKANEALAHLETLPCPMRIGYRYHDCIPDDEFMVDLDFTVEEIE